MRAPRTPGAVLLVASSGGHVTQLHRLFGTLDVAAAPRVWVTFDTAQTRSLLAGERVIYVHPVEPRDWRNVARNAVTAVRVLRRSCYRHVVSTGSGIALSFLPVARALGIPASYIESATRTSGPSLTGRLLARVPGIALYTQVPSWAGGRWSFGGSIFDAFAPVDGPARPVRRVVVTVGTIAPFQFRRLFERLVDIVPSEVSVVWQTGATDVSHLPIQGRAFIPEAELRQAVRESDVVIAHAGVGSAILAIEAGRCPVLVPREKVFGEHVDDHQQLIAAELAARGLAVSRTIPELTWGDVVLSASRRVAEPERPVVVARVAAGIVGDRRPVSYAKSSYAFRPWPGEE